MSGATSIEIQIGRRSHARVRVGLPAQLITASRVQLAVIEDLSVSGAQVTLSKPHPFETATLQWLDYNRPVELVWQPSKSGGVRFLADIPMEWVDATRDAAPTALEAPPLFQVVSWSKDSGRIIPVSAG
ncbi:PilZ domain-containing protein [Tsuneonella sp. SYSU-LHT278]|uniref:PilZ domain-containing protein n=1 Tax=Tsuneonella sediminis TaxID=3416089 RepID=UPI003F7A4158